ncbi:hypothetical protein GCM10025298_34610 [Natronobiforma cellulositropha]
MDDGVHLRFGEPGLVCLGYHLSFLLSWVSTTVLSFSLEVALSPSGDAGLHPASGRFVVGSSEGARERV